MKLVHGMRVTCEIRGEKIRDAKICIDCVGTKYICQNIKDGFPVNDKLGYKYSWTTNSKDVTNLRPVDSFYPVVGDTLVEPDGRMREVLAVVDKTFLPSIADSFDEAEHFWYTFAEAEKLGWKIEGQEEVVEDDTVKLTTEDGKVVIKVSVKKLEELMELGGE